MNKKSFLLILMIFVSVISCQADEYTPIPPTPPPRTLPDTIAIDVNTENYIIIAQRIITDISPLKVKYAGSYQNGSSLYFKIEAVPPGDFFWLAEVPPLKSGTQKLVFKKVANLNKLDLKEVLPLPDEIKISMVIKNLKVFSNRIENSVQTLYLYLSETRSTSDGLEIAVIRSKLYPDEVWEFFYPTENGNFTIIAQRKK